MLSVIGEIGLAFGVRRRDEGAFRWAAPRAAGLLARVRRWFQPVAGTPTVFHVTHAKAGSQWINRILHALAYDRLVLPEPGEIDSFDRPIVSGAVYPTVYLTRKQFESVALPPNSRWFVVIRDLRDTLVSAYFSIKHSHAMQADEHLQKRARLRACSFEEGMLYLLDDWLPGKAAVQQSWLGGPDDVLRYEDLLRDDIRILDRLLLGHCQLAVRPEKLHEVILANRFEARTGGRRPGEEDIHSHERKGIAGDWQNYFTPALTKAFKNRHGELLVATGYEKDANW